MKKVLVTGIFICSVLLSVGQKNAMHQGSVELEPGVSKELAAYRKLVLKNVSYHLQLDIPVRRDVQIMSSVHIRFSWNKNEEPLQIDFKEHADHLQEIKVNGRVIPFSFDREHIIIAPDFLKQGKNEVNIRFNAGNMSLNRNGDFLYTLLVPDRARTVFPCFDQPDIKASFQVTLTIPKDWTALSSASIKDSVIKETSKTYNFRNSDYISTYLFSFVAGKFQKVVRTINGRQMQFLHRETDPGKITLSLNPIFGIQQDAIQFMENYTGIPYPFQKFDFAAIPDFQYGGMEHVGAIQYKASSLFLDEGATKDQEQDRASLLAHETAHMWFGDLVTMRWFDDVWMKEVFANFMADKITGVALANTNYDLKFLLDHFPTAYSIDRTAGANPIQQPLQNLRDAGTLYGNIIYHKAPIVMRQLEMLMGKDKLKEGLRLYLRKYAFSNASWSDLIQILDERTPVDLQAWNKVWVEETGRPQFDYRLTNEHNKIAQLEISQKGEDGSVRIWPQILTVALFYQDHVEEITVNINNQKVIVHEAKGKALPLSILFNSSGIAYGLFAIDQQSLLPTGMKTNPVMRASAYINLYENMLCGRYCSPRRLIELYKTMLTDENEELNLRLITSQLSNTFWRFLLPAERENLSSVLERNLWGAIQKMNTPNQKKIIFSTYQSIATSKEACDTLYALWKDRRAPAGVKLTEDDYTTMALALAVRDYPDQNILQGQLKRIQNPDRQRRLQFLMPALSPDVKTRNEFFQSLKEERNRENEAWVGMALQYLHHPLRATASIEYLKESLDLLEEIQQTGDIFFPQSWLQATFGYYQDPKAAKIVRTFLNEHPGYHPKLKEKILQASDGLFRAEKLVYGTH